jgi:hypothetical protein
MAWLRFGVVILSVLIASGATRVHAQAMPPGTAPADPFHQPCVAVRASPEASVPGGRGTRHDLVVPRRIMTTPAAERAVRKQYVDLDNRCATPPAFAPTRDVDSTAVWHVDAPADDMHAAARPSAFPTWHARKS